jgi:hypothetical protein
MRVLCLTPDKEVSADPILTVAAGAAKSKAFEARSPR